jgi:hypothetical protein
MSTYQSTDNPDGFKYQSTDNPEDSTYQSTDNPDGSVQLIKLMIDLNTFHTFKIIPETLQMPLANLLCYAFLAG